MKKIQLNYSYLGLAYFNYTKPFILQYKLILRSLIFVLFIFTRKINSYIFKILNHFDFLMYSFSYLLLSKNVKIKYKTIHFAIFATWYIVSYIKGGMQAKDV